VADAPRPPASASWPRAAADAGLDAAGAERVLAMARAVLDENERVNLTAAKTLDAALEVLVLDAVPVVSAWPVERPPPRNGVDLGTGNGFPGAVVAARWPTCRVTFVERRAKKAAAVARCLAAAGIDNGDVVPVDGRDLLRERPRLARAVDLVVVRAVGELAPTTREAAPWLARGGRVVHWKSADVSADERRAGDDAARSLGLVPCDDIAFRVTPERPPRVLVVYERP
jgi:16S rRNA G527 N7-methylase RsmG